jgi:hypothetical protein
MARHAIKHHLRVRTIDEYQTHVKEPRLDEKAIMREPYKQKQGSPPTQIDFPQPISVFHAIKHHLRVRTIDEYQTHVKEPRLDKKAVERESYKPKKRERGTGLVELGRSDHQDCVHMASEWQTLIRGQCECITHPGEREVG